MGAIDLLFDIKRDSERLHQLVLGALLSRTPLIDRLVPQLPSRQTPGPGHAAGRSDERSATAGRPRTLVFDPQGKAFDLAVLLGQGSAGPAGADDGGRILVEVKIDAPLSEDHVAQQLSRIGERDHVLYLLLGYSAITSERTALRERIVRIGRHSNRPDLLDRVSLRDARDLIPLLSDPALLPPAHGEDSSRTRDVRDMAVAYRDALLSLQARLHGFASRPSAAWSDGDFYGFYDACRSARIGSFAGAQIGRIASADGSVLGCRAAPLPVLGGQAQLDLAWEGSRLCLRLTPQPGARDPRRTLRDAAQAALLAVGFPVTDPPLNWSEPAPRLTAVMTLASTDDLLTDAIGQTDLAVASRLSQALVTADATLRKVAAQLGP